MNALGILLGATFGRIIAFFAAQISAQLLISAAAIAAFLVMLAGLTTLFNFSLSQIAYAMPAEFAWSMGFIPTNVPVCLSTIITCKVAIWVYQVKFAMVKMKAA